MAQRADVLTLVVRAETAQADAALNRTADTSERTAQRATRASEGMSGAWNTFQVSVRGALTALAGAGAAVAVVDRLGERAERVTHLSDAFGHLGERIGANAETFLPKLEEATGGVVSRLELMEKANNAVILGVAKSEDQFAELADVATRLGRAVGLDATAALDSLVTGIGRQSRLMLDNLGIIVKVEDATEAYARSLGKAASELTDVEQKQAFMNATMEAARTAAEGLGEQNQTLAGTWRAVKTELVDFMDVLLNLANQTPGILERSGLAGLANTWAMVMGIRGFGPGGLPFVNDRGQPFPGPAGPAGPPGRPPAGAAPLPPLSGIGFLPETGGLVHDTLRPTSKGAEQYAEEFARRLAQSEAANERQTEQELEAAEKRWEQMIELEQLGARRSVEARALGLEDGSRELEDLEMALLLERQEREREQFEEFGADLTDLTIAHGLERNALEAEFAAEREAIAEREHRRKVALAKSTLLLVAESLGILFENSKLAAYAHAIINTAEGVTKALTLPFPLNFAVAGLVAAAGAKEIATISSARIGGGGAVYAPSAGGLAGGGGTFSAGPTPTGPSDESRGLTIRVYLEGQGIVQDPEEFSRTIARDIRRQLGRAGEGAVGDV